MLGAIGDGAAALQAALADLAAESAREDADAGAAIACHLGLLAVRLSRLEPPSPHPCAGTQTPPDLPLVNRFMALAGARLGSGHTVGELAEALGVTAATLDRACRKARGRRAIDLIHDLRFETALTLLRTTRTSQAEIAQDLGFTSLAHFIRAFVDRTGKLPESFRG